MGTSTRIRGPKASEGEWRGVTQRLSRWGNEITTQAGPTQGSPIDYQQSGTPSGSAASEGPPGHREAAAKRAVRKENDRAALIAAQCLRGLRSQINTEPDLFGLYPAMRDAGQRLTATLPTFIHTQLNTAGTLGCPERDHTKLHAFIDTVAGSGATVVDSAVRRAARRSGQQIMNEVAHATRSGRTVNNPAFAEELFCSIYKAFFADVVASFIATMIAEQIQLAIPVLRVLDPAALVAHWVGEQVAAQVPNPCERRADMPSPETSMTDLAEGMVEETVRRVLGCASSSGEAA